MAIWGAFGIYVFIATALGVLVPPLAILALLPAIPLIMWAAPDMKAISTSFTRRLIFIGAAIMPLWPVYLHIKLGPLPIITPTRLIFYAVVFVWLYEMSCVGVRRRQFLAAARRLWPLFLVIALLFVQKFISIPFAVGKGIAAKEFFRQSMIWLLPFLAVISYVNKREMFDRLVSIVIISSTVVALVALVEFVTHTHLAEILKPLLGDVDWLQQVLNEKIRDGVFRSQATHTHPLSLGEHLAMIIPFAMYKVYRGGKASRRYLYAGILLVLIAAVLMSNSRGAIIGGVLAVSVTFFLMMFTWLRRPESLPFRPMAGLIIAGALVLSPVVGAVGYKLVVGEQGSTAAVSSHARVEQIEVAWPKILKRPLNGYGNGRSVRILGFYGGRLTIDNYYLNLALELGFPGPILFFSSFGLLAWYGYRWGTDLEDDPYAGLYIAVAGMAVSFAVTRSILSISTNIELLMLFAALLIGTCGRTKYLVRQKRRARAPVVASAATPILTPEGLAAHRAQVLGGGSLWTPAAR